ncbi:ectoderm-neural cortex protein 1-like [Lethenteron reissneri]|uniref:ectoderm-neural cortex protein 1-like n=1 Tax=Lethenteron reissneri TaxID=7753 RepID=UPI002AB78237|nr:ectoderm-neural cortex protein 1-like [Lethenteron reissneri]
MMSRMGGKSRSMYHEARHPEAVLSQLNALRRRGLLTDVVLRAGSAAFPCHRAVLAACSTYFQAMFGSGLRESHETEVDFADSVAPEALGLLLDYAYTSRLALSEETAAEALLQAADMLQFPEVRDACADFLERRLSPDNCLAVLVLADAHGCMSLRERSRRACLRYFPAMASGEEILSLSADLLLELVGSEELEVEEECVVLETCLRWVRHDSDHRHSRLPELLKQIRLALLPLPYLTSLVDKELLVAFQQKSQMLVKEALSCKRRILNNEGVVTDPCARPRQSGHSLLLLAGQSFMCDKVYLVDQKAHEIVPKAQLPNPRKEFSACAVGCKVYVTGGRGSEKSVSKDVWVYDNLHDEWGRAAPMLVARFGHGSAELGGELYVVGGHTAGTGQCPASPSAALKQVERYNPATNSWSMVAPLREGVSNAAVVSTREQLYVFGGTGGVSRERSPRVQCYQLEENRWSIIGACPQPWRHTSACLLGKHIFVLGGDTECSASAAYCFHTETHQWTRVEADGFTAKRMSCHAVASGNRLHVVGGYFGAQRGKTLDCYEPASDSWENVTSIPYSLIPSAFVSVWKHPTT